MSGPVALPSPPLRRMAAAAGLSRLSSLSLGLPLWLPLAPLYRAVPGCLNCLLSPPLRRCDRRCMYSVLLLLLLLRTFGRACHANVRVHNAMQSAVPGTPPPLSTPALSLSSSGQRMEGWVMILLPLARSVENRVEPGDKIISRKLVRAAMALSSPPRQTSVNLSERRIHPSS